MMAQTPLPHHQPVFPDGTSPPEAGWGSDFMAQQLARLDIPYMALVPGSSFRGLHDSLVQLNRNRGPEMLVCLHEEHAIAIAHGYAKVTDSPLAVGLHANVGLMHGTMGIYNAFCDRVPMLLIGATGPLDAMKRRPWIDWLHTFTDQAALVRHYVKWDDQPGSVNAAIRSILKAYATTRAKPWAPTYVVLDVTIQEDKFDAQEVIFPTAERYLTSTVPGPSQYDVQKAAEILRGSRKIVFLLGRVSRSQKSWDERVKLAELLNARVVTDMKQSAAFPTAHRLHPFEPTLFVAPQALQMIKEADVIVSWEWVDLAGLLVFAEGKPVEPAAKVIQVSTDSALHNGWSKDHFDSAPVDLNAVSDPDAFLGALLAELSTGPTPSPTLWPERQPACTVKEPNLNSEDVYMADLAAALHAAVPPSEMCLIQVPISFHGTDLMASHPLSSLGLDGAAGLGAGPGKAVGAALALKDTRLLPVSILGDGDFLMGSSALWTAAHYRIPLLVIVANNASYYNDEVHQERVAKTRSRPVENKWIGMRLDDPMPDVGKNAESYGATVLSGQVKTRTELGSILSKAVQEVRTGRKLVVLDVKVLPFDYSSI